jgi:hypothetical protein
MFTAEELITARDQVRIRAEEELSKQLAPYSIVVENFNIINFDFSPEFQAAIEAKQVAQQAVETAKQRLFQAEIDGRGISCPSTGPGGCPKGPKRHRRTLPGIPELPVPDQVEWYSSKCDGRCHPNA